MKPKFNPYHTKGTIVFGRLRKYFLGSRNPGLFTRINCNIAIAYFLYIFLWGLTIFIAFHFGQNLPKAKNWNELFIAIGAKYNIADIKFSFSVYLFSILAFSVTLFGGIIMAWRNRVNGYYIVVFSTIMCAISPLIFLGTRYVKYECGWWEFLFPGIVIALFTTDYMIRRKRIISQ